MSGRIACFPPRLAKFAMAATCAGWDNDETKAFLRISNVMALCSRTDTANSRETYAGREVTKYSAVSNFVSADRIQVDRIGLRLYWIESRSNLVPSVNAPLGLRG